MSRSPWSSAERVAAAFARAEIASGPNIMSTGDRVYSYKLLIARRTRGRCKVLDVSASPSQTTSRHIRAVQKAVPSCVIVPKL